VRTGFEFGAHPSWKPLAMPDCLKVPYPTPRAAGRALVHIQKAQRERGRPSPAAVHPCALCHQWHVTSQAPAGTRAEQWQVLAGLR